jgi:3-deoxy-D-manno-octulosonic-acid transferase
MNLAYFVVLVVCAPLIVWTALRTGKYREGYGEKLLGRVPRRDGDATCLWIHAVSVGEVNLLATTLGQLREAHPEWQIVISTTTKTGYDLARKIYGDSTVFYCPLDFSWAVRTAMRRVRPTMLVLAELELWPNLIQAAKEQGVAVAIINGRLSDHSFRGYRRLRPLVAHVLRKLDVIAAHNEETAERFRALGAPAERVYVTGSLKYDGAQTDRRNPRTVALAELAGIADGDLVLLAGSTQEPEEQIALEVFRTLSPTFPRLRLVLVPRHPERFDAVAKLLDATGIAWVRRSQLDSRAAEPSPNPSLTGRGIEKRRVTTVRRPVLLVDTVGELGAWWGATHIAFVGGSFGDRGGQNMIEPAAYGAAVSFGPNTWNFRDIVASLLAADGAVVVHDAAGLAAFVRRCLEEPAYAAALGARAQALVESQLGATRRTVELLEVQLERPIAVQTRGRSAA